MRWVVLGVVALFAAITIGVVADVWGESLYQHFEPALLNQHAQNIRNNLNYTDAANQQAESYMNQYKSATDTEHANNLLAQFCSKAGSITTEQRHPDIQDFYQANCQ